jgi:hypothetical protein
MDGQWLLCWIILWENSEYLWSCKVGDYEDFDFGTDLFNFADSIDVNIPYESGKIWLTATVWDHQVIGSMRAYYRNGIIMEEYNDDSCYYKRYSKDGTLELLREGTFFMSKVLKLGYESRFDTSGTLIDRKQVDYYKH